MIFLQKSSRSIRQLVYETSIKDFDHPASFDQEVHKDYCILRLNNGKKAFAHISRVWIFKQPLYNGFYCLKGPTFKNIFVNARSVKRIGDVEYQVTFCHAGVNQRDYQKKKFVYPEPMIKWFENIVNLESLNQELNQFQAIYKH